MRLGVQNWQPTSRICTHENLLSLFLVVIPIFFAAITFAKVLQQRTQASAALGYNLFGAMVGGVLEYFSTIWGINNLNLFCVAAYMCAGISWMEKDSRSTAAAVGAQSFRQ